MSDEQRPSRRRRIAGESGAQAGGAQPPRRVVKRPVTRPGTPPASPDKTEVESAEAAQPEAPETGVVETEPIETAAPAVEPEDPAVDGSDEAPVAEERTAAPRIVPAGRRAPRAKAAAAPAEEQDSRAATGADDTGHEPDAPAARRSRRGLLVLVAAVLAVVLAAGSAYWALQQVRASTGVESSQAEATAAAATASETILTYRFDQLDEHLEEAQALMTPSYAEDFETISPALDDLAPQRQIVVEATARESAALPCGDDCSTTSARVLVFVDQARVADGAEEPTVFGNRITLSMVERDGQWLVDDIEAY